MTPKEELLKLAKQTNNMPILMLAMTILSTTQKPPTNVNIAIPYKIKEETINTFYQWMSQTKTQQQTKQNFINTMNNWKEFKHNTL